MNLPNTLFALHQSMVTRFAARDIDTPELDARRMIQKRTGFEWSDLMSAPDSEINTESLAQIALDVERRLSGEPISRIYGEKEFWSMSFKITPDTLDPRPDTETLVEAALNRFKGKSPSRVLDLGTGSGCILIALLSEWQEAKGLGVDISADALSIAKENAQNNGVSSRAAFICSSWGEALIQGDAGKFDVIVSNPPYISNQIIPNLDAEVREFDPILALDGGNDGLDAYRLIIKDINLLLNKRGIAFLEIGYDQQKDVVRLVEDAGLSVRAVHADLAGQPRVVEISSEDK